MSFRISRSARSDLENIVDYTCDTWGTKQALLYINKLEVSFQRIAGNPLMGRSCDNLGAGVRRLEHGRHVIFYRPNRTGVLIIRVLHQSMLPGRTRLLGEENA